MPFPNYNKSYERTIFLMQMWILEVCSIRKIQFLINKLEYEWIYHFLPYTLAYHLKLFALESVLCVILNKCHFLLTALFLLSYCWQFPFFVHFCFVLFFEWLLLVQYSRAIQHSDKQFPQICYWFLRIATSCGDDTPNFFPQKVTRNRNILAWVNLNKTTKKSELIPYIRSEQFYINDYICIARIHSFKTKSAHIHSLTKL